MKYVALFTGAGEGCDYTIGCNRNFIVFGAENDTAALARVKKMWDEYGSEQVDCIELFCVSGSIAVPVEQWADESEADKEREEAEAELEAAEERAKVLRAKLGMTRGIHLYRVPYCMPEGGREIHEVGLVEDGENHFWPYGVTSDELIRLVHKLTGYTPEQIKKMASAFDKLSHSLNISSHLKEHAIWCNYPRDEGNGEGRCNCGVADLLSAIKGLGEK